MSSMEAFTGSFFLRPAFIAGMKPGLSCNCAAAERFLMKEGWIRGNPAAFCVFVGGWADGLRVAARLSELKLQKHLGG